MTLMDLGEFSGRRLYTGLRLDDRLRLQAPTSASRAISAVAELLVCDLTFSDHVSFVSLAYHIKCDLRRIRPVLDCDMARTTGASFVHFRLDYCNFMYCYLRKSQLNHIQRIQNAVAAAPGNLCDKTGYR